MKKRFFLTAGILCGVLLILGGICLGVRGKLGRSSLSARQAERWAGDSGMTFTQFSCYFPEQGETNLEGIYSLRQKLTENFRNEGIEVEGADVLFCDAWSAMGSLHVSCDRADADTEVLAVGGDFFDFHPMELLSGCFLRPDDLMKDRVVLDELLAWLLFGSSNVAGMQVEINGLPYEIAGVVRQDDSRSIRSFHSDAPTMYMPYETYQAMTGEGVSCYEIVLPEPVKGYGESTLKQSFSLGGGVLQPVTGRFSLKASWELLKEFRMRGTQTQAVALPYWENAARYDENRCAFWLLAALILLLFPALCACAAVIRLLALARKGLWKGGPKLIRRIGDGLYRLSTKLSRKKKRD